MTPQVKICGLTRPQDIENALVYGADYLGFIVEAKSARKLSVARAAELAKPVTELAKRVAVTVNADNDLLQNIMENMQPDFIQCHGDESPQRVSAIRSTFDVKVIKALAIKDKNDLADIPRYSDADLILLDAKAPKGLARGGHGVSFDWNVLTDASLPKVFLLAGGLTSENVYQAIDKTNAPILDVSSGVESAPGIKDTAKIKTFMEAARNG